jgi:hypothetical protein
MKLSKTETRKTCTHERLQNKIAQPELVLDLRVKLMCNGRKHQHTFNIWPNVSKKFVQNSQLKEINEYCIQRLSGCEKMPEKLLEL